MDNKSMNIEKMSMSAAPVFWNADDAKWYFTEKHLTSDFQITYETNPQAYKFFRIFYNDMMLMERLVDNPMDNVTPQPFQTPLKNFVINSEEEIRKIVLRKHMKYRIIMRSDPHKMM